MRVWGRATSLAGVACAAFLVHCGGADPFACTDDSQCASEGGVCGPAGYCAFPSADCASELKYGEHAGSFAGMCVVDPVGDGTAGDDDDDDDDDGTGASESDGATSPPVDTGDDDDDDDDDDTDGGPTLTFTDDELDGEFGEGMFDGTTWADAVVLDGTQGSFTSRVFDAGDVVTWTQLSWQAGAPYARPLLDNEALETGYTGDAVDMTDNVLLLHLDDRSEFDDTSGHGNHASAEGDVTLQDGVFSEGLVDSDTSWLRIPIDGGSDFQFDTTDFTWSLWVNTTDDCFGADVSNNQVYLGTEDQGPERTHIWFGCVRPQSSSCDGDLDGGRAGGTFRSFHTNEDGTGYCGTTVITDGQWHHMAVVKEGHPNATVRLFVDGEIEDERNAVFDEPLSFVDGPDLTIGAFVNGSFQASGSFDEIAVWRRALGDEEVRALWLRGVRRLGLRVRACQEPTCNDAPPFSGNGNAPFVDSVDEGTQTDFQLGPARYFQYTVSMSLDQAPSAASPRLLSVTVGAEP